ncbi:alpha/beta fold hydrolase BchO [Amorphus orientalis]|uniref:Magnesium chelatase accessory protein n=1 Tax=Amorphus orientalis TaxID=649198 RepID=A0AAE4ARU4_9HYPH|nr:alpha/beta fold hydrolase BchO [Amorphus orientalis]MDQ0315491.1 magnesium chelatase accessory protein [Amorphus orientalis]
MLTWDTDGRQWPNRETSDFVRAGELRWHVQRMGHGPDLLLLHGTAASTHSWRDLMPLLAAHFRVTAPDLPGHGFTETLRRNRPTLPAMAAAVRDLLEEIGCRPSIVVGHSAGAAIAARLVLDGALSPRLLVALNGAFLPFRGAAGQLFPSLARALVANPLVPHAVALSAGSGAVARMLAGSGSTLDAAGLRFYGQLFRDPTHVGAALQMMANWDLATLERDLPKLAASTLLLVGSADRFVDPIEARKVCRLVPHCERVVLPGRGHLMHEEDPAGVAEIIVERSNALGALEAA